MANSNIKIINSKFSEGFTLIELMISMGILIILFAMSTINLTRLPATTSQVINLDSLISDIRSQQTKAMTGNTEGGSSQSAYGIHFNSGNTSYTLFKGTTYSSADSNNFVVELDPTLNFANNNFTGQQIVFLPISGNVSGYVAGQDSIQITNSITSDVKTLRINKYGATY